MTIEITGVSTWNKGAELMLVAILEHVRTRFPQARVAVDPWFGTYEERAAYRLWLLPEINRAGRSLLALRLMPRSFQRMIGLVTPHDVDVILDAAGFAFGDQHPAERTVTFARRLTEAKRAGKRIVLLPQALGPFSNPVIREAFSQIVAASDLVYARDQVSFDYVKDAVGATPALRLAPDFTNLVKPAVAPVDDLVWIVPNERMIEKAESAAEADAYLPLLTTCIEEVERAGLRPKILIHGRDDASLLKSVRGKSGQALDVVREEDPVAIKRLLGGARFVVASRFHALASALSQGVPSIATSWSHKYEMLLGDYGCADLVLPVPASREHVRAAIEKAAGPDRSALIETLRAAGARLEARSQDMWAEVDALLDRIAA